MITADAELPGADRQHIRGDEEISAAAQDLLTRARHRLEIFAPRIEVQTFNDPSTTDVLNHFASSHQRNRGQFVITDETWFFRFNPRLVDLCRRLNTFYEVRRLNTDYPFDNECFIIVDRESVFHQPKLTTPVAVVSIENRSYARHFARKFERYWQAAESLQELFTIGL